MKRGWTEAPLGELCELAKGSSPTMASEPGQYPLVVTAAFRRTSNTYQFTRPAACIPVISSTGHGNAAIHRIHYQEGRFALANLLVAATPKNDTLLSAKYLWRYLSVVKDRKLVPLMQGTANVGLKEADLRGVTIEFPPLGEQQRLTARLDAIESRLNRVRQLREEQTQTLRTALRSAFHRLIASAEWKTLAEVAPLAWRKVEIEPDATYTEFGVRSFYKGVFLRRKVSGAVFDWQELFRLKPGDIVFSNIMAWEKAIAVAGPEHAGWVGNHRMLICEPREEVISASCLLHYFMTEEGFGKILHASPGTAARNKTLKADRLMDIKVPVPPLAAQREFQKLLTLQAQVTARAAESDSAAIAILPSLLDQIFN